MRPFFFISLLTSFTLFSSDYTLKKIGFSKKERVTAKKVSFKIDLIDHNTLIVIQSGALVPEILTQHIEKASSFAKIEDLTKNKIKIEDYTKCVWILKDKKNTSDHEKKEISKLEKIAKSYFKKNPTSTYYLLYQKNQIQLEPLISKKALKNHFSLTTTYPRCSCSYEIF